MRTTAGAILCAFGVTALIAALAALVSPPEPKQAGQGLVHCQCTCDGDQAELQIEKKGEDHGG